MNQFLIGGIPHRAVYSDNPNGFGEERGGCCQLDGKGYLKLCEDCGKRKACPADGEKE
jgi:hypothetical protein